MRKIEDKLVYTMGGRLEEIEQREWTDEEVLEILRKEKPDVPEEELISMIPAKKDRMGKANKPRVILTNSRYAKSVLDEVHMDYEGDVRLTILLEHSILKLEALTVCKNFLQQEIMC